MFTMRAYPLQPALVQEVQLPEGISSIKLSWLESLDRLILTGGIDTRAPLQTHRVYLLRAEQDCDLYMGHEGETGVTYVGVAVVKTGEFEEALHVFLSGIVDPANVEETVILDVPKRDLAA